jgi:hypothetical protein
MPLPPAMTALPELEETKLSTTNESSQVVSALVLMTVPTRTPRCQWVQRYQRRPGGQVAVVTISMEQREVEVSKLQSIPA